MIRDTILLTVALTVLASLAALAVWDWREAHRPGGVSLSDRAMGLWHRKRSVPTFWLVLGMVLGFTLGLVAGFILGHLFWPQTIEV